MVAHRAETPRRVVITGYGVVSPLGNSPEVFWSGLIERKSGVGTFESGPEAGFPVQGGGAVRDFTGHIDDFGAMEAEVKKSVRKGLKLMCRETQMGVAVAQKALAHSGYVCSAHDPERRGVSYGTGYMMTQPEDFSSAIRTCVRSPGDFAFDKWGNEGMRQVTPLWLLKYLPNMPACHIAIYNDFRGPNNSLTQGEAAANLAIGEAAAIIARGGADMMLAGGTGTRLHPIRTIHTVLQEEMARAEGRAVDELSRPFDRDRLGMVLGEGAAAIILEEYEFAVKRGAKIYGEVLGFGSSCAVGRDRQPLRDVALANAMQAALRKANRTPETIGHLHAHGVSTRSGDVAESQAIHKTFNGHGAKIPVVAAKANFGNLGAGSGAVELVASLIALERGHLFPIRNYETPDPECSIHAVRTADVEAGTCFLNLSVAGNGQASALLVQKV